MSKRLRLLGALRSMTVERGCTVSEAEVAAEKARALLRAEVIEALNEALGKVGWRAVGAMKGDGHVRDPS